LCAADVDRLQLGNGLPAEAFEGGLAAEAAVGSLEVVEVSVSALPVMFTIR